MLKRVCSIFLVLVLGAVMCGCSGKADNNSSAEEIPEYRKVIEDYFSFFETGKTEYLEKCYHSDTWTHLKTGYEEDMGEYFEDLDHYFEHYIFRGLKNEFGEGYKASYTVTETTELDSERLDSIKEDYINNLEFDEGVVIDMGYQVNMSVTVSGTKEQTVDASFVIVQIDGQWDLYYVSGLI